MDKNSELIGVIVDGTPVKDREVKGEVFNRIIVRFLETEIPVLISTYISTAAFEKDTKVKVTGCLISDIIPGVMPKFYFYANSIEQADIDSVCTNVINFSCTVTKVKGLTKNSRCIDILSLIAADSTPIGTTSILYLTLKGQLARRLSKREKGYVMSGKGRIRAYKDIHEVLVTEVNNLDQIV